MYIARLSQGSLKFSGFWLSLYKAWPICGDAGISAMTSVAASRVCSSGSCNKPGAAAGAASWGPLRHPRPPPLPPPRRWMFERANGSAIRLAVGRAQFAEALQRPQRVHRAAVDADRVDRGVPNEREQLRDDVLLISLDEETLRRQSPEHVVGGQRLHQAGGVALRQRPLLLRRRALVDDAIYAPA